MVYIVVIESAIIIVQLLRHKLYRTSSALVLLGIFNTFVAPMIYFSFFNGDSYKRFTETDYNQYLFISIVFLGVTILLNSYRIYGCHKIKNIARPFRIKHSAKVITLITVFAVSIYVLIYRNGFPVFSMLKGSGALDSLSRPDMTGDLPGYFSIQTVMIGVIPCMYFYFYERVRTNWNIIQKIIYAGSVIFMLIAGGNKGILLYYFIFLWLFVWKAKVDWRIILSVSLCVYLYMLIMNGEMYTGATLLENLGSPIRRFFVTQGAMFINRISLMNQGFQFDPNTISKDVFTYVYGFDGGTAPTFFAGDMIVNFGFVIGIIVSLVVLSMLFILSVHVDLGKNVGNLYIKWYLFFILYLAVMSGLNSNFLIRILISAVFVMTLWLDSDNYIKSEDRIY